MSNTIVITLLIIGALLLIAMFYCMDSFDVFKKPKPEEPEAPYKLEPLPTEIPSGYPPIVMAVSDRPAKAPKSKRVYTKRSNYWKRPRRGSYKKRKTKAKLNG